MNIIPTLTAGTRLSSSTPFFLWYCLQGICVCWPCAQLNRCMKSSCRPGICRETLQDNSPIHMLAVIKQGARLRSYPSFRELPPCYSPLVRVLRALDQCRIDFSCAQGLHPDISCWLVVWSHPFNGIRLVPKPRYSSRLTSVDRGFSPP
jgi:hypothetical protein